MGDIADGLINGDFDFYTGEYMGRGYGAPRTRNKSLPWEKRRRNGKAQNFLDSKESAYNGVKRYIGLKWDGRKDIPSVRSVVYEYTGESNFDLKQKCLEIQNDFKKFVQWINKKLNDSTK